MKNYFAFVFITSFFILSCKNSKQKNEGGKQSEKKNFFPVANYIESEIHYVDSLPIAITKYIIQDNKTDTSYIQSPEYDQIAQDFICPELKPDVFEKEFSETSFVDQSTQTITFTYSTKNNKLDLQRVDVLANADNGLNKVSSIYLEKAIHKNDTFILKKLLWVTRTSFQIVTSTQVSSQSPVVKELKLVWGIE